LSSLCNSSLDCASGNCVATRCSPASDPCGVFAGCTTFTDLTAPSAMRTVHFPVGGNRYQPACMRVRFGQTLTFQGDFVSHALAQACGPVRNVFNASSGQSLTLTADRALGVFGYYCKQHGAVGGSGMTGAVEVVR
jgi:plastocyanin